MYDGTKKHIFCDLSMQNCLEQYMKVCDELVANNELNEIALLAAHTQWSSLGVKYVSHRGTVEANANGSRS
jgi:hypothetical protein